MSSQGVMEDWTIILPLVALCFLLLKLPQRFLQNRSLDCIPTVGFSLPLLHYISSFRFLLNAHGVIGEGYTKYKSTFGFKFALFNRWFIIVNDTAVNEELRKAPDTLLSSPAALHEFLQGQYTLGMSLPSMLGYIDLVRVNLLRDINPSPLILHEEVPSAFRTIVPDSYEWSPVPVLDTSVGIFSRISNRAFVGLPLCTNAEYNALNKEFTHTVFKWAIVYNCLPRSLRPVVANVLDLVGPCLRRGIKLIEPLYKQRLHEMEKAGNDWTGKDDDMLSLLVAHSSPEQRNVEYVTRTLFILNLAAVHTTSHSFAYALFQLASNSEWAEILREEVQDALEDGCWDRGAFSKMRKLDSFLQESLRFNVLGALGSTKVALQDVTLTNGLRIPKGTLIAAPLWEIHRDNDNYPGANTFYPWRFYRDDKSSANITTTTPTYLTFGHGKTACPGRFFATMELKLVMAHLVLNYDVKLEEPENIVPSASWYTTARVPNLTARVLFRSRKTAGA